MRDRRGRLDRREFLSQAGVGGALLAAGSPLGASAAAGAAPPGKDVDRQALRGIFTAPPEGGKPMTRWWWFGGAVTPEEITRELTLMREAGLRGVELQPVYPVEVDNPQRGVRNVRYFSQEWFDLLRHTARETKR